MSIPNKLSDEQTSQMETAYRDGATLKELATRYEVSSPTVSKALRHRGVPIRPKGRRPKTTKSPVEVA
jgi:transposase